MAMLHVLPSVTDDANERVPDELSAYALRWHFFYNVIVNVGESVDVYDQNWWLWLQFCDECELLFWAFWAFEIIDKLLCCFLQCVGVWDCQSIRFLRFRSLIAAFKAFSSAITLNLINIFESVNETIVVILFKLILNGCKQLYQIFIYILLLMGISKHGWSIRF
jgi:hypothetical protein